MASTMAPEMTRILAKLAASMSSCPRAIRHKTEFAAKAINASVVRNAVLTRVEASIMGADYGPEPPG